MALDQGPTGGGGSDSDTTTEETQDSTATSDGTTGGAVAGPGSDTEPTDPMGDDGTSTSGDTGDNTTDRSNETGGAVAGPGSDTEPTDPQDGTSDTGTDSDTDTTSESGSDSGGETTTDDMEGGVVAGPDSEMDPSDPMGDATLDGEDTESTLDAGGDATTDQPAPGSGPGGYAPGPGGGSSDPTDPQGNYPELADYDDPTEYVEDATQAQFQSVDDGEIYATTEGDRVEPRFTERGARQAAAALIGVSPSSITLEDSDGDGAYTLEDIQAEVTEQREQLAARGDVAAEMQELAVEDARIEAAQEARADAERRAEAARGDIRRGNLGDPRDIIAEQVAQQKTEEYGFEVQPSDVDVRREDGEFQAVIPKDLAEAGAVASEAERTLEGDVSVERTGDREFDVSVSQGYGTDAQLEQGVESELDAVAGEQPAAEEGEQFGNIDWSFGMGGSGDEVESFLDQGVDVSEDITRGAGDVAGGFGRGAAGIATTPLRLPGLGLEAAETGVYVASGDSSERAREVAHEGVERVGQATSYYIQNPVEGGTVLAGSLATSYGAMAAASKYGGPVTSTATRYAIQPGEEAAKTAARAGLVSTGTARAVPGVRSTSPSESAAVPDVDLVSRSRGLVRGATPDTSASDLANRIKLTYQRYRYSRPPKQETPHIDLADADDVDAVYVQDFRPETDADADADTTPDADADGDVDAGSVGTMGTTFDGPVVEVDAGGGQRMLLRTRAQTQTRTETQAELESELETNARSDTELRGSVEPEVPYAEDVTGTVTGTESAVSEVAGVESAIGTEVAVGEALALGQRAEMPQARITETGRALEGQERLAAGVETETEAVGRLETAMEAEQEVEARAEARARTETAVEAESDGGPNAVSDFTSDDSQPGSGGTGTGDTQPGAGWLNRYAVALAGGGVQARRDPENIEEISEDAGVDLALPTRGQVDPSEELAAGLESVESLFFLDDSDSTTNTDVTSGDDGGSWFGSESDGDGDGGGWF